MRRYFYLALGTLLLAVGLRADDFVLKADWTGPCAPSKIIDVNIGNTPETFVKAAYCQIFGKEPDAASLGKYADQLRTDPNFRRVDLVRTLFQLAGRKLPLAYSNPWSNDPVLAPPTGTRSSKRDVGAVTMFFFNCPGGVNCGMDWANAHAPGMSEPVPGLAWGNQPSGYYKANNPGFWKRELEDAKAAGLQFIMPNVYGPDLYATKEFPQGGIKPLAEALSQESDPVKVAMFDDTWAWGEKWFGPYWEQKPDLGRPDYTSKLLYTSKWKPFFSMIPRQYWYTVKGKPLIYFYSTGKLQPITSSSNVIKLMKALFKKDFGVEPFVAVDKAYFDDTYMADVADAKFIWDPLKFGDGYYGMSRYRTHGITLCSAMVKWDPVGRDHPEGKIADSGDQLIKGGDLLKKVLNDSMDADILVFATWSDLGEGTNLNRCYDYWYLGTWLQPNYFMNLIRDSQFHP